MRLIYVNSSKVTKLEQKMNNSESFLLLLKNLLKCTYEVLLPSQRYAKSRFSHDEAYFKAVKIDNFHKVKCDIFLILLKTKIMENPQSML